METRHPRHNSVWGVGPRRFLCIWQYEAGANTLHAATTKTRKNLIGKRRNTRLRPTQNQGMDVVRALIGVHHFQIHQMPCYAKLI